MEQNRIAAVTEPPEHAVKVVDFKISGIIFLTPAAPDDVLNVSKPGCEYAV